MNYNDVAYKALSHWNLQPSSVTLIAERENRVFKVIDSKGKLTHFAFIGCITKVT